MGFVPYMHVCLNVNTYCMLIYLQIHVDGFFLLLRSQMATFIYSYFGLNFLCGKYDSAIRAFVQNEGGHVEQF